MKKTGKIISVGPRYSIPGGEVLIECEAFEVGNWGSYRCVIGGRPARLVGASTSRVVAIVPDGVESARTHIHLEAAGTQSEPYETVVGERILSDMHIVANPAVDPKDDALVVTRSGGRGQELPFTMYRLEPDGYLDEMPAQIQNPTGVAFDQAGELYVTNRADGEVCKIERGEVVTTYASGLGIATGLAFDQHGVMFVGDRSGTIFQIPGPGRVETFAVLEPSVAAYHLAFGPDERLYVTAPGFGSHDFVYAIDRDGAVEIYFRGFGRPQGLAFDTDGNLYAAACYRGRRGIFRIAPGGSSIRHFVAGMNIVGLCFTRKGDLIAATGDSLYSIPAGVYGTLLN